MNKEQLKRVFNKPETGAGEDALQVEIMKAAYRYRKGKDAASPDDLSDFLDLPSFSPPEEVPDITGEIQRETQELQRIGSTPFTFCVRALLSGEVRAIRPSSIPKALEKLAQRLHNLIDIDDARILGFARGTGGQTETFVEAKKWVIGSVRGCEDLSYRLALLDELDQERCVKMAKRFILLFRSLEFSTDPSAERVFLAESTLPRFIGPM